MHQFSLSNLKLGKKTTKSHNQEISTGQKQSLCQRRWENKIAQMPIWFICKIQSSSQAISTSHKQPLCQILASHHFTVQDMA